VHQPGVLERAEVAIKPPRVGASIPQRLQTLQQLVAVCGLFEEEQEERGTD
jgi:hypothetical protein